MIARSALLFLAFSFPGAARLLEVANDQDLRAALAGLRAGDTLRLAPGDYRPDLHLADLRGTAQKPIVIEGRDRDSPPRFAKGKTGLHLANCAHLTLRHLEITDQKINGLNIDDGGDYLTPSHHILLENLCVKRVGPSGNFDAIKLSGVDDFVVRECVLEGWAGQAIDMVGCHRGIIESCTFQGLEGFSQHTGPQTKGGSEDITIRHCTFRNAGGRPLQLGGSTGLPYFRPRDAKFEARRIIAHDNLIVGGQCAVVFASLDGGEFHHNTVVNPEKWVLRILQENNAPGFPPCRGVRFHHNLVVFERARVGLAANVGANTDPSTFTFSDNLWHASDSPARSKPRLPSAESSSRYGVDPKLAPDSYLPAATDARSYGRRPPSR